MAEFTVQIENLDQLVEKLRSAPEIAAPILQRALFASQAILAQNTTRATVPWRTGFLTHSFQAVLTIGLLRWYPTASYARFVEFGTKPHVILPKDKKALFWPGASHPVHSVNHPGQRANPYMERIIAASQPEISTTFETALAQIVEALAV